MTLDLNLPVVRFCRQVEWDVSTVIQRKAVLFLHMAGEQKALKALQETEYQQSY